MKKLFIIPVIAAIVLISHSVAFAAADFNREEDLGEASVSFTDCSPDLAADCTGYNNWGILLTDGDGNLFLSDELVSTSTLDWSFNVPDVSEDTPYTVNAALCADTSCDEETVFIGETLAENVTWDSEGAAAAAQNYANAKANLYNQSTGKICKTENEYNGDNLLVDSTEVCYDPVKAAAFQGSLIVAFIILTSKVAQIFVA